MNTFLKNTTIIITIILLLSGCAPQAQFFNVDVKRQDVQDVQFNGGKAAVFSITNSTPRDSIRISNASLGLAEKLEKDRNMKPGEIPVFSIPQTEFSGFSTDKTEALKLYDKAYLQDLMLKSDGDIQIFVNNLKFYQYSVNKLTDELPQEYGGVNILLPYSIEMQIYNALQDSLLYSKTHIDTVYMQVVIVNKDNASIANAIAANLSNVSRKIGENLASKLTVQWETQERMLITYAGEAAWEKPYLLAQDFKWKEAIDLWIELSSSPNPKRAAFAAYNVAVACEMTEQFPLAMEWVQFSLKKFKFREAEELRIHLLVIKKRL
ncbi:MAG: DUF6340 family protein [Bacteroidales bacterium]